MKAVRVAARSFSAGLPPLPGLCGLQYLHTPDDFRKLVKKSITSCKKLRQTLSYNENIAATNPSDTLLILDQISNELCKVLDSAEFVRNLHEDEVFRDAAQGAFDDMSEFMHELNCDTLLYKRLDEIIHKKTLWRPLTDSRSSCDNNITISLSEEERVFAGDLYKEFISEGIHLSETPGAQDALGDLKANISGLETEFMRNINTPPDPSNPKWLAVGPFDETKEQLGNYSLLRNYLENTGIPQPEEEPGAPKTLWCLPIKPILNSLLASATSSNIRSQLYSHMLSEPVDNAAVLAGLVAERHRYARFLGHSCFSEKYLQDKILSTPGQVMSFLKSFSTDIRPQAEEELEALTGYYHDHCSDGSGRGGGFGGSAKPLNIWDIGYAIRHGRNNDAYAPNNQWVSRGCSPAQEAWRSSPLQRISGFLHVDNCLGSLEMLCDGLFGVKMQRVSLGPEEGWVCGGSGEQLVKYELVAAGGLGESLGFIYFDLFRRGHKFSNSAHFTVQCGCSNSDTDRLLARFPTTPFASASIMDWLGNKTGEKDSFSRDKTHNASVQSEEARYQLPTVVLVLNLSGGYLSLDELETLYHEFGHALHSLLSRTTFQYLSGTRGSTDFIEVGRQYTWCFTCCVINQSLTYLYICFYWFWCVSADSFSFV